MEQHRRLCDLPDNGTGTVEHIATGGSIRTRLMELGLIENTEVQCIGTSPLGDPRAYMIRGAVIALRSEEAKNIYMK